MKPHTETGKSAAVIVAVLVFCADVATKEAILRSFRLQEAAAVTAFVNLGYWLNPGAAFSFLSNAGGWQRYFFTIVAMIAIAWLGSAILFNVALIRSIRTAFALIAGGAAGNLYDRLSRGAVVDWIDLHWAGWHWPAFNLADCAIVLGAALVVLAPVLSRKHIAAA